MPDRSGHGPSGVGGNGSGFGGQGNFPNIFQDILEDIPEAAFFSRVNQLQAPNQQRFFQDRFQQFHNQFLGMLGSGLQSSNPEEGTNLRFTDFINNFDFGQRFAGTAPGLAGRSRGRFAPVTRFF